MMLRSAVNRKVVDHCACNRICLHYYTAITASIQYILFHDPRRLKDSVMFANIASVLNSSVQCV